MQEFITNNVAETEKVAQDLAKTLQGGETLALFGNLGSGKTVFVKAMAKTFKIKDAVTSPTFVLMKVYDVESDKIKQLVHVDCYRLENKEGLADIGLVDYLNDPQTVAVIEWAEKILNLPENTIKINIDYLSDKQRKISIN